MEYVKLKNIAKYPTGKLDSNAAVEGGKYPFFTCAQTAAAIDTYAYDGEYVLLGGNNANGNFPVFYYNGKFNAYQRTYLIQPTFDNIDTKYLYYAIQLKLNQMRSNAAGTATKFLTKPILNNINIEYRSLDEQRYISSILSTYDELIENNNRRIRILEQMAENLYKEWFVRFRFPGHEQAEFENGIPKGWAVKRMKEFCYVTDGTHDTPTPVEIGVPLVTGKCISSGRIDFTVAYNISISEHEKIKKRSGLKTGDILFSNIGTVGNCCIVDYDREFSVKNVIIFKPKCMREMTYLYYWLTSKDMQDIFATQTNGASQQFVGLTFMRKYKILVPDIDIMEAFSSKLMPIIELQKFLRKENQNLTKQRDMLLPRLMSGKLEV